MARAEYGRYNPSHFLARRSRTTVRRAPGIFLQTADRRRAPPPTHYSIGKIRLTQRMYVSCASSPLDLRQLVRFDVAKIGRASCRERVNNAAETGAYKS